MASQNRPNTIACPTKKRRLSGACFSFTSPVNRGLMMRQADTPTMSRTSFRHSNLPEIG